jgi:uncharacterized membrane protein YjgN (DUF898 family)
MEITPDKTIPLKNTLQFQGKGSAYARLYVKNMLFVLLTFGIYYPWARIDLLKYLYQKTALQGEYFALKANAKDIITSYLKLFGLFLSLFTIGFFFKASNNDTAWTVCIGLLYTCLLVLVPFIIHGAVRYRASHSHWANTSFHYEGIRMNFFRIFTKGYLLTLLTFGIYGSWFQVAIRKYLLRHLKFGDIRFDFEGSGEELFWIQIKMRFFFLLTAGLYSFWYFKNLFEFYVENTKAYQNENEIHFKVTASVADIAKLYLSNFFLIVCTFGLAFPWVYIRTFSFVLKNISLQGEINYSTLKNTHPKKNTKRKREFLNFLDFDLI